MQDSDDQIAILSAMGEVAMLRDAAGAVLWVNPAFCELFGGSAEDWRGHDFGAPRQAEPGARRRYEGETATRQGRRWIEWEETVLSDGRLIAVGRDITQRRDGEQALRGARDQAIAARRVGKAFFSAVTHELRTPLHGLLGMAGLLKNTELKPDQAEYVSAIRESGDHLLAMISDVLDAARLEAGDLDLEDGDVACGKLVRSVVELLAPRAFEKGLEIAQFVDPRLPALVAGDEGRMRQILFNLTGAAVARTERGGVVVSARLDGAAEDGFARIAFSVADDGPDFTEDARLFMVQPELMIEDENAMGHHAGMGLVVARRLVKAMGGDLEIENSAGNGACVTVRLALPVRQGVDEAAPDLSDKTLVIASGSSAVRAALADQARAMGAQAVQAATPGAALREVHNAGAAILLGDASWRDRLREAADRATAAGLLLRPDQRDQIPGLPGAGFDFYLMKPVRGASLAARLQGLADEDDGAPASGDAAPASSVAGARILLAEDNRVNALLATTMLRAEGCHVDVASDGAEAVKAVQRAPYDLVFMDVRMPVKNGIEATREIRSLGGAYAELPIVALTANAFKEDRAACLESGMNDFATKPIDMDGVAALLQKWTRPAKQAKLA